MRSVVRVLGVVFVSAAMAAGHTPANAEQEWSPPPITWQPCPDSPAAECGKLRVPLEWSNPDGQSIDLAVARRKATDPARRLGVLLVDPGGPGGSGVGFSLSSSFFSPEIRARFDIVGFDQRGTGNSPFIRCSPDLLQNGPTNDPADQAGFDALVRHNLALQEDCRQRSGPIFDHANSALDAQDMDAVRRALGERKINYFGISYGTTAGQQYAEKFGDRIRAMVLDSSIDHSADTRRFIGDRAASAEASFLEFVKWCERTPSCVLHGQDVLTKWDEALARADRTGIGRQSLIETVHNMLYTPAWPAIAQLISNMTAGAAPATTMSFQYNYPSIRLSVVCQDFSLRIENFLDYSRLRAEELRLAPAMRGSAIGHDEALACAGIPGPAANPPHRLDIRDAPKILLLNSRYDPATPYSWAEKIHRQAREDTALLTYEGWGHGVYHRSDCTTAAADDYLFTLRTPAEGASCPAVEPPA